MMLQAHHQVPVRFTITLFGSHLSRSSFVIGPTVRIRGVDKSGKIPVSLASCEKPNEMVVKGHCCSKRIRSRDPHRKQQCIDLTISLNKKEVMHLLKRYYMKVDEKYQPAQKVDSERMLV
jgi:hypothetical protein